MQNHKKNVKHVKDEKCREKLKWNTKNKKSFLQILLVVFSEVKTTYTN